METQTMAEAAGFERLLEYVSANAVTASLVAPGLPMPTVAAAAAALSVSPAQIVKSILFQEKRGSARTVLAIAGGSARISPANLARAIDFSALRLAPPATVLEATGFAAGGVPPIGHAQALLVVLDRSVLRTDVVFGGGGDEFHMLRISPGEIVRITNAQIADLIETPDDSAASRSVP
jgi:prolyl-tRNA editing enzyme YbaK/EbsC (Cys-tRNA(Pro) deacylase)